MATRKDGGVEAPVSLGGFFAESDDEAGGEEVFDQHYEVQELAVGEMELKVRQFAWHMANANKVWPGTFTLALYIEENRERYSSGPMLELGAATGALAIYLSAPPRCFDVTTTDIDDGGDVEANIGHNFALNNVPPVRHIPHTWGTGWPATTPLGISEAAARHHTRSMPTLTTSSADTRESRNAADDNPRIGIDNNSHPHAYSNDVAEVDTVFVQAEETIKAAEIEVVAEEGNVSSQTEQQQQQDVQVSNLNFKYIIASDILLYVSAYPALVQTLVEIFNRSTYQPGGVEEFLMSWNRRISSTGIFFDLMEKAGFQHEHLGKCIYSFKRMKEVVVSFE